MSYILDALRKADQDRTIGDVPDLATSHWTRHSGGGIRGWVWAIIALLLVNVVLLAFMFGRDEAGDGRSGVSARMNETVQEKPLRQAVRPPPAVKSTTVRKERTALRSVPETPQNRIAPPPPRPVAVVRPRAAPKAPAERVRTSAAGIPEWSELSLEFRREFDPPKMDVHVYAKQPSRRFILVRLQRYTEGDTLASGAILERILPEGIELNYRGTRFRIDR